MRRGTTPTLTYTTDVDLTGASVAYLTFMQGDETVLEKTISDMTITATEVACTLTQEDTLALSALKTVAMQIRAKIGSAALGSNIIYSHVGAILKDGVI